MTSSQLIRNIFVDLRDCPWEHFYEPTPVELVVGTFALNGAPRSYQQENLLRNQSGLIGMGKGFGLPPPSVLPAEFVYLWACFQAAQKVELDEQRAEEWGFDFDPPTSLAELSPYLDKVYALKHTGISNLGDIKQFLAVWRTEVMIAYVYAHFGRAAMEPDTSLGRYGEIAPRDRKLLIGPLHLAWENAKLDWKDIIDKRVEMLNIKRSPVKRMQEARAVAAKARKAKV